MANKNFKVRNGLETDGALTLNGGTSGTVSLSAPAIAGTQNYTLPTGYPASNGYVLSSTTGGTLSWAAGSGGTPGGSNTQIQFNNSGAFGGSADLTWDGTYIKAPYLNSTNSIGDEGGEILLAKPATNSTIAGTGVTVDVYQNKIRFFEQGGSARGAFIDITKTGNGVATDLLGGLPTLNSASDSAGTIGGTSYGWSFAPGLVTSPTAAATTALTSQPTGAVYYVPMVVTNPITINAFSFYIQTVTTLTTAPSAQVFISNVNNYWQPTSVYALLGQIPQVSGVMNTTGLKSVTGLSQTIPPGNYLLGLQHSSFTAGAYNFGVRTALSAIPGTQVYRYDTLGSGYYWAILGSLAYVAGTPTTAAYNIQFSSTTTNGIANLVYLHWTKA